MRIGHSPKSEPNPIIAQHTVVKHLNSNLYTKLHRLHGSAVKSEKKTLKKSTIWPFWGSQKGKKSMLAFEVITYTHICHCTIFPFLEH